MRPHSVILLLFLFLILFVYEFHAVIQFSPVDSWALKAKITDNGTFYYIWKPICSNSLRIGDLVTTVDYQSSSGTPPTNLLHCVHDLRGQVSPASTFTVQGTFTNTLTNNSWEIVRGSTTSGQVTAGQFVRVRTTTPTPPSPAPTPGGLIPSVLTLLSLASVTNGNILKRTIESYMVVFQSNVSDDQSYYSAFPNNTCFQPCNSSVNVYRTSSLGFDFIVYNPFESLGAFTSEARIFIVNRTATIVPYCLTIDCVCGPCLNGGKCNQYGACICPPQWNGSSCEQDVNECALQIDNCDPLVKCVNNPGGYNCTSCPSGYFDVYGNGTFCKDINECSTMQYNCSPSNPNCTNLPGGYNCTSCPSGSLETPQGCTFQYCGNDQIDPGEQCDGGFRCLNNCTCASGFGPTPNISVNCTTACGNARIDRGEECDGGIGCNSLCKCERTFGFIPSFPPSVNCANTTFFYSDSCILHSGNCSECLEFNCIYCLNTSQCRNTRVSLDCNTFCLEPIENENNNSVILQPPGSDLSELQSGLPTNLLITLVVIFGALVLGVLIFLFVFCFYRKNKKQKSQDQELTTSRTPLQYSRMHGGSLISLTEEWTPPSNSTSVKLSELPVKFSKILDFNIGKNQFHVNEPYVDVLVLTLKEDRKDEIQVEFHPSVNPRYELVIEPQSTLVKKGKEVEVKFTLTVTMTTEVECSIGVSIPKENLNSKMIVKIVSEPSPFIDFDELVIDSKKPVGDGGFGTVYRGQYRGTDAAIKILKVQELPDDALEEFSREIDLMAKLRHKNIVQFLGASRVQGKFAIVTEFIELGSVANAMKNTKFSYALKLKIACDAARALNFLHKNKIIHRDLKLENLLLVSTSLSAPVNAKLTDFGASRAVSEKTSNKYTTGIGTPLYMAPEILRREPYDLSSDIYSFGMMLWALMAEREPWSQYTHAWEIANIVIEGKRETIPALWPSAIVNLIQRCWAQNPRDRPEAKEVCQILQTITAKELEKHNAAKMWK